MKHEWIVQWNQPTALIEYAERCWRAATPIEQQGILQTPEGQASYAAFMAARAAKREMDVALQQQASIEDARARQIMSERASRATTGTSCYLRFGRPPKHGISHNYREHHAEAGISVYAAVAVPGGYIVDLREVDQVSGLFITANRPIYLASRGHVCGHGSDGEPLLSGARFRPVSPNSTIEILA